MNLYENNELICSKEMDNVVPTNLSPSDCVGIGNEETSCSILIGEWYDSPKFYFTGKMDNLYIYDYVVFDVNDLPCNFCIVWSTPKKAISILRKPSLALDVCE